MGVVHCRRDLYQMELLPLHGSEQLNAMLKKWVRESHDRGRRIYDVDVVGRVTCRS